MSTRGGTKISRLIIVSFKVEIKTNLGKVRASSRWPARQESLWESWSHLLTKAHSKRFWYSWKVISFINDLMDGLIVTKLMVYNAKDLLVYSVSKWNASSATTVGWKGGETDFFTSCSQSMEEKKVCAYKENYIMTTIIAWKYFLKAFSTLMSSIPLGPDPSLLVGFLLKRARSSDWASGLRKVGIPSLAWVRNPFNFWSIANSY